MLTGDGVPSISCIGTTNQAGHAACSLTATAGTYSVSAEYDGNTASRLGSASSGPPVTFSPVACAAGSWSADGHQPCAPADVGHYVNTPGATAQAECAPSSCRTPPARAPARAPTSVTSSAPPEPRARSSAFPGSYQSETGSVNCLVAQPGFYVSGAGASSEVTCPVGSADHVFGATQCVLLDTTAPTVTNVTSSTADGFYRSGATVVVTVTFSEQVIVTGTPQLALNSGARTAPTRPAAAATPLRSPTPSRQARARPISIPRRHRR